jgi:alanyl aminopeptidase
MRIAAIALGICLLAGPAGAADPKVGRLGRDVVPLAQSITLDLDPRRAEYSGSVEVRLEVKKRVPGFQLHGEKLDLGAFELSRTEGPSITLEATALPDGVIDVRAEGTIAPGAYTLRIAFRNDFDTEATGLYRLKTGDAWYAFTQFEAIDARQAFPCWDEPSFKIPYSFTVTAPADQMALANTPEVKSSTSGDKRTTVFATTRPLPSYLLAIAVGPFETVPVPGTSIPTRIVTVKGAAGLTAHAIKMTPPILAALEAYFGSRYPYEKLDLIGVPEYWYGAMENPGLITFVDNSLLLDPVTADPGERERLAVYLAHEIGHMWFGDLVTMAWWDDLWLNESFATWIEQKMLIQLFPEFDESIGQVNSKQRVMVTDTLLTSRAMRQPVQSVDSLLQSADALAYAKGAAVLNMVEGWIGPEAFRAGVFDYLAAHADGNASADDLWSALGKASKKDVKGALSSFLDQAGVPFVTAEILPEGRVRLSQTRFLASGAKDLAKTLWTIPVALRYPAGNGTKVQRILLKEVSQVVRLETEESPAWLHPNADEIGYYRWSVSGDVMDRMTDVTLSRRERVGFLGNAQALLAAGRLPGDVAVEILRAYAGDEDPEIVASVATGIELLRERFFSEHDDGAIAPFVRQTLEPALRRIGPAPRAGEPAAVTRLRPVLYTTLADAGREPAALAELERLAQAYLADRSSVDPSLADAAVMASAIRGDAARFDAYRKRFEAAAIPAERRLFLDALGNFRDPALVDKALAYVLAGPLRPQELFKIPQVMGEVPASRPALWTWMTKHYDDLAARIPADYMIFMPWFAAGCSPQRLSAAKAFFADPKHSPPGTSKELARVVESVDDCVALDAREGDKVRRTTTVRWKEDLDR